MFLIGYNETTEDLDLLDEKQVFQINGRGYLKKDKIEPRTYWLYAASEFPINFKEKQYFYNEESILNHSQLPRYTDFLNLYFYRETDFENQIMRVSLNRQYWKKIWLMLVLFPLIIYQVIIFFYKQKKCYI